MSCERTFYVVFCDMANVPWWMRPFVCGGFQHCFTLAQVGPVVCAVEQVNYAIMQHTYWNTLQQEDGFDVVLFGALDVEQLAAQWAGEGYTIVRFTHAFDRAHRVWTACNLVPSCVTLCKNLLGVKCWAQTPYQLYRWLLAAGGEVVKGGEHGQRAQGEG